MTHPACNRRDFLKVAGLAAASLSLPACTSSSRRQANGVRQSPNIIIILADDLGYGDLACYGNTDIRTPNLDALAAAGMRFTDFHSNGCLCSPTRAALLTGRYQQRCGIEDVVTAANDRDKGMPLAVITFAEVLETCGYTTGLFGKWHLGYAVQFNPIKQGFDEFRGYVGGNVDYISHIDQTGIEDWWTDTERLPEDGYTTDLITAGGVDFIRRHRNRPFCLYLAHEAPHYPYQGRGDAPERTAGNPKASAGRQDRKAAYKGMVEAMDEGVGRIMDTLRRLRLQQNTFVFFFSDNGAVRVGSNGPLRGFKGGLFEGGHRVPAIACWPGRIAPGTITGQTAIGMDLLPTMALIAGAQVPPNLSLDGIDLSPVLFQGGTLPPRALFWRYQAQRAIRKGPWKLLVVGKQDAPKVSLFNLADDLGEKNDLAGQRPELVGVLKAELDEWDRKVSAGVEKLT